MKRKLINSLKDFLNTVFGDNENVWNYLESYLTSEQDQSIEHLKEALNKFVEDLNEINCILNKDSDLVNKKTSSIHKIPEGNSSNTEAGFDVSFTRNYTQPSSDEKPLQDASIEKTTLQNEAPASTMNKNLVQIIANKSEIERRIASFIECKRMDVDEENRREFCSDLYPEHGDGDQCARTSAVFIARSGGRSHVAVSRVVNANGPQLRVLSCTPSMSSLPDVKCEPGSMMPNSHFNVAGGLPIKQEPNDISAGIEERIKNMEVHLKISPESVSNNKSEVFERLKALEKRILFLESISPEYFNLQLVSSNIKKRKLMPSPEKAADVATNKDMSLVEIDDRIHRLRSILKKKQLNLECT